MIRNQFRTLARLDGWRHLALGQVGSTNVEAMNLASDGDLGQVWVTAERQSAGKARRGRSWISKPGNLYASLLLIDPAPADLVHGLPLVTSVALHKALCDLFPSIESDLKIKWPNDLLLKGKKVSGLLLEASVDSSGRRAVVVGCGVNCAHFPDNPMYPATSLEVEGYALPPIAVFQHFAIAMADTLRIWNRGAGMAGIQKDWLSRAKGVGELVTARFDDREITGRFEALDADGYLILVENTGQKHHISAADIFFGNSHPFGQKNA